MVIAVTNTGAFDLYEELVLGPRSHAPFSPLCALGNNGPLESIRALELREKPYAVERAPAITRDNVDLTIDAVVYLRVVKRNYATMVYKGQLAGYENVALELNNSVNVAADYAWTAQGTRTAQNRRQRHQFGVLGLHGRPGWRAARSRDRGPGYLSGETLLHKAHDAVRLQEAFQSSPGTSAWV